MFIPQAHNSIYNSIMTSRLLPVLLTLGVLWAGVTSQCDADFDLVFVVDSSGSIRVRAFVLSNKLGSLSIPVGYLSTMYP